jgi:hypothetical protein
LLLFDVVAVAVGVVVVAAAADDEGKQTHLSSFLWFYSYLTSTLAKEKKVKKRR